MTKRTFWDDQFKELNAINVSESRKKEMLQNIKIRTKKYKFREKVRFILFASTAIALSIIITASMLSVNIHKDRSSSNPNTLIKPNNVSQANQIVYKSDSASWKAASRLRYDFGSIEKIETNPNGILLTIKRINSFGSDTDPIDTITPDTTTRTYVLRTSQDKQILNIKVNQNVLLLNGQYLKKNSPEAFWSAEVAGETLQNGKLYSPNGQLLNLVISSKVKVENGLIFFDKKQILTSTGG